MTMPDFFPQGDPVDGPTPPQPTVREDPTLFDKCHRFFEPTGDYARVKAADLYPFFRPIERNDGSRAIMNGREIVMAGSNNYLGLTSDPRVQQAAIRAIEQYGTGCTGSRFLNGTLDLHEQAEERFARDGAEVVRDQPRDQQRLRNGGGYYSQTGLPAS